MPCKLKPKATLPDPETHVYLALLRGRRRGVGQYQLSESTLPFRTAVAIKRRLNRGRKHPRAAIMSLTYSFLHVPPGVEI